MDRLAPELMVRIAERAGRSDLTALVRTSKQICRLVTPTLYRAVGLGLHSFFMRGGPQAMATLCGLKRHASSVQELEVYAHGSYLDFAPFQRFFRALPKLHALKQLDVTMDLEQEEPLHSIVSLIPSENQLESLTIPPAAWQYVKFSTQHLTQLCLTEEYFMPSNDPAVLVHARFFEGLPNLTELQISHAEFAMEPIGDVPQLESLTLSDVKCCGYAYRLCSHLKTLVVTACEVTSATEIILQTSFLETCLIRLNGPCIVSGALVDSLLKSVSTLHNLCLEGSIRDGAYRGGSFSISEENWTSLVSELTSLKALCISFPFVLRPDGGETESARPSNIEHLFRPWPASFQRLVLTEGYAPVTERYRSPSPFSEALHFLHALTKLAYDKHVALPEVCLGSSVYKVDVRGFVSQESQGKLTLERLGDAEDCAPEYLAWIV